MKKILRWLTEKWYGVSHDDFWERQLKEQRERHAREIFALERSAGIIITDESEVDGIRYGDLNKDS